MGKLSIDSIPLRYSAYFILAQDSKDLRRKESTAKEPTHLEQSIDYFTDASGERRQDRWIGPLNFFHSSLFRTPDVIIQKKWTPLPVEQKTEPVEKPLPEWASPGTCLPPMCWGIR